MKNKVYLHDVSETWGRRSRFVRKEACVSKEPGLYDLGRARGDVYMAVSILSRSMVLTFKANEPFDNPSSPITLEGPTALLSYVEHENPHNVMDHDLAP